MMSRSKTITILTTTLIVSSKLALAADPLVPKEPQQVYAKQLMTEQERSEQRSKMRAAPTAEEREKIHKDNQEKIKQQAKEQGVTLIKKKQNKQMGKGLPSAPNTNKFDRRQTLPLNQAQQAHILTEMRSLLVGTQVIVAALATDDMDTIAKQARLLGMKMKKKPEDKLRSILPKAFMMQGKAVHMAFDIIADDAASIKNSKHTLKQLSEALRLCQGCHEMYRIEVNNTNLSMDKQRMKFLQNQGFVEMKE